MAEKHVAVCDECGVEAAVASPLSGNYTPDGWLIAAVSRSTTGIVERWDLCSWSCLELLASRTAARVTG
jgi:hypothetical protein